MSFSHVQGAFGSHGTGSQSSISATGVAITAGNFVAGFVICGKNGTGGVSSVTDDKGNTYTLVDDVDSLGGEDCVSFYRANIPAGPSVITANLSGAFTFNIIIWDEFSGVATSSPLDGHAMQAQASPGTGTDACKAGTAVGASGDLIYAGTFDVVNNNSSAVAGTGFTTATNQNADPNVASITEYLTASGAHDGTFTLTINDGQFTGVMAFKPAAGFTPKQRRTNVMIGTRVGSRQAIGM